MIEKRYQEPGAVDSTQSAACAAALAVRSAAVNSALGTVNQSRQGVAAVTPRVAVGGVVAGDADHQGFVHQGGDGVVDTAE